MKVFVMRHFDGFEPGQIVEVDDGWGQTLISRNYAVAAAEDAPVKKGKKKVEVDESAAVEGGEA